jgi:hypothetical protein
MPAVTRTCRLRRMINYSSGKFSSAPSLVIRAKDDFTEDVIRNIMRDVTDIVKNGM